MPLIHKSDAEFTAGEKFQGHFPAAVQADSGNFEDAVYGCLSLYHSAGDPAFKLCMFRGKSIVFSLQFTNLVEQAGNRLGFGVRQLSMLQVCTPLVLFFLCHHHPSRNTDNRGIIRDRFHDDGVGTDFCPLPYCKRTKNLGAGADHHVVQQRRMTFDLVPGNTAQGNSVVEGHIIAYLGRLAYDNPHAVINKKLSTDLGARMDFDTGQETADMRGKAAEEEELVDPEPVGDTIEPKRMQAGIAKYDLQHISGGRIAFKNRVDVFTNIF